MEVIRLKPHLNRFVLHRLGPGFVVGEDGVCVEGREPADGATLQIELVHL